MNSPQVGQRWVVDTDSSLGLGIVTQSATRSLTIAFPAADQSRCYSRNNAPLTRVVFVVGDTIDTIDGNSYVVAQVEVIDDLVIYLTATGEPIPETQLAATIALNHPLKRLLAGQLDKPQWFDLRAQLAKHYHQWLRSDVVGLQGARITLTPHQLYVAAAATSLANTRVLLADEVGLGKTIEAGLILQRLLLQEAVQRVLILVPDALRVQWFVELVRCFNIHAVLFSDDNGDLADSRIFIAAHTLLTDSEALTDLSWDMVIVDEAHHVDLLHDNPAANSLKTMAESTPHLLLLSATPEAMGLQQHFARLQLLDSSRFYAFSDFQKQYDGYESLAADLAQLFCSEQPTAPEIAPSLYNKLRKLLPHIDAIDTIDKADLVNLLLDCHGTGRVLFRNTRSAMQGFPERKLISHQVAESDGAALAWLAHFVKQHADEKILFITHTEQEVLAIREYLYRKIGIDCPLFHPGLTLVERDRAAAYFADQQAGAPLLLCSEIGSEGRNFQFCHHLICWDLPEHPDILEQRIGRLDRIGQTNTINIHVCISNNKTRALLHWYHNILDCIEKTNPAAAVMHEQWYEKYQQNPSATGEKVKQETLNYLAQLHNGRDRLLEMNSCRQPQADQLLKTVVDFEANNNPRALLIMATDLLNIHLQALDENRFSLIPSEHMLVPMIPGIAAEGCEITFERNTAIAREDVQFITWDHPLMQGLSELISTSELGVSTVALWPNKALKPGMLFFEAIFTLTLTDPLAKAANRYLSTSLLRVVVTKGNPNNLHSALPQQTLSTVIENARKPIRQAVVKDYQQDIRLLAEQAQQIAQTEIQDIIDHSLKDLAQRSHVEQTRLQQLQQRNPHITLAEVERQKQHYIDVATAIRENVKPDISAVRLLVTCKPEQI